MVKRAWREVWQQGFAPQLSDAGLEALRRALAEDDARLLQEATTTPPGLACVQDWPTEAACALALTGWLGDDLATVGEVEEYFARVCFAADQRLGEPGGCRWFLSWADETPRDEFRRELLVEVRRTQAERRLLLRDGELADVVKKHPGQGTLQPTGRF